MHDSKSTSGPINLEILHELLRDMYVGLLFMHNESTSKCINTRISDVEVN